MLRTGRLGIDSSKQKLLSFQVDDTEYEKLKAYLLYKVLREGNKCERDTGNYGTR